MVKTAFTDEQKKEFRELFVETFKDVVLPGLDALVERMDRVEKRMEALEKRMKGLEDKVEELKVEVMDVKRRLKDLENDTVSFDTHRKLVNRVEILERRFGIV